MNFWIRNIVLAVILSALAIALLYNQDLLFSMSQEAADDIMAADSHQHTQQQTPTKPIAPVTESSKPSKRKNAAAEGLSRFYANLHGDMNADGPKIRNNIVYLPEPSGDLVQQLEAKRMTTRPLPKTWLGSTDNHPFRQGETLLQKLSEYAQQNGLEVIWWLNLDFLVKDPFRVNKNIITTAYQVGKAIEGHFQNGLTIYFCYQQRTIVLIEHDIDYLARECLLLPQ
ncbi:Toxin co-regulated pilus biosynthesis protein Q [Colwellia chukchiensis]|uniref:Toxin co-regulated pilus biosynthesis protein Q n=1 Tax=Colwellia chukchiensis TaxID=641665 RepID=A0A1H7J1L7_9GAMM|nr:TcpQ domain-containing protein [Colwellia chukchiensis]SEK68102.1 Toxin co-regulated pilus biosynthesis protein Q [Colwellia chukchiensis]